MTLSEHAGNFSSIALQKNLVKRFELAAFKCPLNNMIFRDYSYVGISGSKVIYYFHKTVIIVKYYLTTLWQ